VKSGKVRKWESERTRKKAASWLVHLVHQLFSHFPTSKGGGSIMKGLEVMRPNRFEPEISNHNYGKFVVSPIQRELGITLGNSMRRILLSSLKGLAIVSVKIDGVLHEFSTIPGVVEDVTQIILNLKRVRFKAYTEEPLTLSLEAQGGCEVTAADIKSGGRIDVVNPDCHIATLDKGGKLNMELRVRSGRGWAPAEQTKSRDRQFDLIPIDAIFSPVQKANFRITDSELESNLKGKLTMEVWTDATMSAQDVVSEATQIFMEHLRMFVDFDETYVEEPEQVDEEEERIRKALDKPVAELELSVRAANCLEAAYLVTIRDLVTKSESEMLRYRNFGRKSLNEIKDVLAEMGLSLGMNLNFLENSKKS